MPPLSSMEVSVNETLKQNKPIDEPSDVNVQTAFNLTVKAVNYAKAELEAMFAVAFSVKKNKNSDKNKQSSLLPSPSSSSSSSSSPPPTHLVPLETSAAIKSDCDTCHGPDAKMKAYIYISSGQVGVVWHNVLMFALLHTVYVYAFYLLIANKLWHTWFFRKYPNSCACSWCNCVHNIYRTDGRFLRHNGPFLKLISVGPISHCKLCSRAPT